MSRETAPSRVSRDSTDFDRSDLPSTERRPVTETLHGVDVEDPYRWLEDGGEDVVVRRVLDRETFLFDRLGLTAPSPPSVD